MQPARQTFYQYVKFKGGIPKEISDLEACHDFKEYDLIEWDLLHLIIRVMCQSG